MALYLSWRTQLDRLAGIVRIAALSNLSRARFMVARDHQIPFWGARPDLDSLAFALMATAIRRGHIW